MGQDGLVSSLQWGLQHSSSWSLICPQEDSYTEEIGMLLLFQGADVVAEGGENVANPTHVKPLCIPTAGADGCCGAVWPLWNPAHSHQH